MPDRLSPEALFLKHLGWIDRVAAIACHKQGLTGAEAEDFTGWIRMKLMENDYAALRQFRGDAKLTTYLVTVVTRQLHEYLRERRGRWRPSAAAQRLGPPAPELETLVHRDGYRLDEAGEKLRTAGRTALSDAELARLLARLPARAPLRPVEVAPDTVLPVAQGDLRSDERITAAEAGEHRGRVLDALARVLDRMEREDQVIVRMHFGEGQSLADVARALGIEQKPLYRRVDRLRKLLRGELESEGVRGTDVREMLGEEEGA